MRRIEIDLVAFKDENTGDVGLAQKEMPRDETTNAATDGVLLAHDVVEHVNGPRLIGTIDDELEALGAVWYVRGQHGSLQNGRRTEYHTPEENIAADVTRMFRDHVYDAYVSAAKRTRATDHEEAFAAILDKAERDYSHEINDEDHDKAADMWPAYRAAALAGMRTGYRKAFKRWERHGRFAANTAFWAIADAVEPCAKHAEEYQTFRLTYDVRSGEARCWETTYDDVNEEAA